MTSGPTYQVWIVLYSNCFVLKCIFLLIYLLNKTSSGCRALTVVCILWTPTDLIFVTTLRSGSCVCPPFPPPLPVQAEGWPGELGLWVLRELWGKTVPRKAQLTISRGIQKEGSGWNTRRPSLLLFPFSRFWFLYGMLAASLLGLFFFFSLPLMANAVSVVNLL